MGPLRRRRPLLRDSDHYRSSVTGMQRRIARGFRGHFAVGERISATDGDRCEFGVVGVRADLVDSVVGCRHRQEVPVGGPAAEVPPLLANARRSPDPASPDPPPPPPAPRREAGTDRTTADPPASRGSGSPPRSGNRTRPPRTRCTPPRRHRPPTGPRPGFSRAHPLRRARAPFGSAASSQRLWAHRLRSRITADSTLPNFHAETALLSRRFSRWCAIPTLTIAGTKISSAVHAAPEVSSNSKELSPRSNRGRRSTSHASAPARTPPNRPAFSPVTQDREGRRWRRSPVAPRRIPTPLPHRQSDPAQRKPHRSPGHLSDREPEQGACDHVEHRQRSPHRADPGCHAHSVG